MVKNFWSEHLVELRLDERKYMPRPIKIEMIQDMLKGFRDTADIARNLIVVNSKKEDEYVHVDNEATTIPAGTVSLR